MFGQTWYNHSIKNYIHLFGTLFQNLSIQRYDSAGSAVAGQLIRVPISFAQKQKWLIRLVQDPKAGAVDPTGEGNTQKNVEIQLPRMAFELKTLKYDKDRVLMATNRNVALNNNSLLDVNYTHNPVPYVFPFDLNIAAKNIEDIFQIIEQILPYFKPFFTVTIQEDYAPFSKDIFVTLTGGPDISDEPYGDFEDNKLITALINFEVAGYLYGPPQNGKIIREVDLRYHAMDTPGGFLQMITTDPSNLPLDENPDQLNIAITEVPETTNKTQIGTMRIV